MQHDPGMTAAILGAGAAFLALFAMARVACIDIRRLEIDPDWASLAAWAGLAAIIAVEGPDAWPEAVATAAVTGGVAWLAARLRPGRIGQGDIGLFAVLGLLAGPDRILHVMGLVVAFCLAACGTYGLARGKRLFRSAIPAALPFMAALAPVFAWRIASASLPDAVPAGAWSAVAVALAGAVVLAAGLIAGALPMAVRRREATRITDSRGHGGRTTQPEET